MGADVTVTWFGHSMFLIRDGQGHSIVTDPYSEKTGYTPPHIEAAAVTVSHYHYDHDNLSVVGGDPQVIDSAGSFSVNGIEIKGIQSFHDEVKGDKRGNNIIYRLSIGELTLAHMGDYGEPALTGEQRQALQEIDVLFAPVGGTYTLDYKQAAEIVQLVQPKIVIPMHFKTKDCVINIASVEPFLDEMRIYQHKGSTVQISASSLPEETEVWVMDYVQ